MQRALKVPTTYPFSNDRVEDPKRKGWFEEMQRVGKEVVRRDYEGLVGGRGKL